MRDYASRQRNPARHWVGVITVIAMHLLLVWAIHNGLARQFVKVIKGPVEALLIEDAKPDLPPPPPPPPPPSKQAPPPEYVPPSEAPTQVSAGANAIGAVTHTPAPQPAPAPAPPAPQVRVAPLIQAANCQKPDYPSASRRNEEEGTVQLRFLVGIDGKVIESQVEKTSGYARLDEAARAALARCQFKPGTVDGKPEQAWASMKYTWRLE